MIWVYVYLIIFLAIREPGRGPVSQSADDLPVSIAKDKEWGNTLPGCEAFRFCFTWFHMFGSLYTIRHTSCGFGDSDLHLWTNSAAIFTFVNSQFPGMHIGQAGHLSDSGAVSYIWKVSKNLLLLEGIVEQVSVKTARDRGSEFGAKHWCRPENIPRESVVSLGSHSHHLKLGVEVLPSSVLLVIRQGISTVMLKESGMSPLRLIWNQYWNMDTYYHWVWKVWTAWL